MDSPQLLEKLAADAARCVKCGLCLPTCPTYQLSGQETESPRGRLALIEAVATQNTPMSKTLDLHLDNCLLCRQCEAMCPSKVEFAHIMDEARVLSIKHRPFWLKSLVKVLTDASYFKKFQWTKKLPDISAPLYQKLIQLNRLVDTTEQPTPQAFYPAMSPKRGTVALFKGCVGGLYWQTALVNAAQLLSALGYDVQIPEQQACCGALNAHIGDSQQADRHLKQYQLDFSSESLDFVLSLATGCSSHLITRLGDKAKVPHKDINIFLSEKCDLGNLHFKPLKQQIALHTPCSFNTLTTEKQLVQKLLSHIPDIKINPLTSPYGCCGAAGTYMLSHEKNALLLRQPLLDSLKNQSPDYLVTSNPGCAMHLQQAQETAKISFMHPVSLLAQQLDNP